MREKRNIIVGQSGGPTSVINSSLAGVLRCRKGEGIPQGIRHAARHSGTFG